MKDTTVPMNLDLSKLDLEQQHAVARVMRVARGYGISAHCVATVVGSLLMDLKPELADGVRLLEENDA